MSQVNQCRKRAYSSALFKITKEELSGAQNLVNRARFVWLESHELLDDWLSILKSVVEAVKDTYRASFELLKGGGNFKNEPHLGNLRRVLISMTAELQVFKCWRLGVRACSS